MNDSTIDEDNARDLVNGGAGRNLLFANRSGRRVVRDLITGRAGNESPVDLGI